MQSYASHRKFFPLFHFIVAPLLIANWIYTGTELRQHLDTPHAIAFVSAFTLILLALAARTMALTVQDRVIRLEMRLRLKEVLPVSQHASIAQLSRKQLVGLRFASDAELPSLVQQILKDNITSADSIKKMVKDWQADDLRA
jgi:hypothetical protein